MPPAPPNAAQRDPVVDNSGLEAPDDLLGRFQGWDHVDQAHWATWREDAREAYDFYAGRQWTADEVRQLENLNRIPVVFNRLAPTIDAVSGAEIGARQQVQYFPRQVGDTAIDDILTEGAEWIMDECEGDEEDSGAFRDVLICGVGCTETRPDFDLASRIVKERVDPLEITWDASARKACFADARHLCRRKPMSKDAFRELWPGAEPEADVGLQSARPVIVDPRIRYDGTNGGADGAVSRDEVIVREYQWFERQPRHLVGGLTAQMLKARNPDVPVRDGLVELTADQHDDLQARFPGTRSARITVKVFFRAFVAGAQVLEYAKLEVGDFTYKAMTGKRDRNKGTWYGLVRPMIDPQKWANKVFSQILHIMRSNAQGGLLIEKGAGIDPRQFEASWADASAITWVEDGTISSPNGKKFDVKPMAEYPTSLDKLMAVAVTAVRDTTGVNQEMLGSAGRDQPGVLESQRTQQAFGILAAFFDSKRRYHAMQGRLLLKTMALYLPADTLVRVTGADNDPRYVPLALTRDAADYDVIVDEAPAGPNQKMAVFQILMQLTPLLQNAGLGAKVWAEIARYSPLPAKVAELIASDLMQKEAAARAQSPAQARQAASLAQAKAADGAASAQHHAAQAALAGARALRVHVETAKDIAGAAQAPDLATQEAQAKLDLTRATTSNLLAEVAAKLDPGGGAENPTGAAIP
ncbi:MAG TPA: hypothetical protein VE309_11700 [Caulobacteraceae bacterium]|nr:hypothetical protein [Caulobacteraceae bacterium]